MNNTGDRLSDWVAWKSSGRWCLLSGGLKDEGEPGTQTEGKELSSQWEGLVRMPQGSNNVNVVEKLE